MKKGSSFSAAVKKNTVPLVFILGLIAMLFSNGRVNIPVFAWIWPGCFLYAFRTERKKSRLVLMSVLIILTQGVRYFGYTDLGFALDEAVGVIIGASLLLPLFADRFLYPELRRKLGGAAVLFAPAVFTAVNMLLGLIASIPVLAYSQTENLPLVQVSSLIGAYGLSFLIFCFGGVVNYAVESGKELRTGIRPACAYAAVMLAVLVFGGARLIFTECDADYTVQLALALTPAEGDFADGTLTVPSYEENAAFIAEKAALAKAGGAVLLSFAEEGFEIDDVELDRYLQTVSEAAKENGVWIMFTVDMHDTDDSDGGKSYNKEFLFDANGEINADYCKYNLLPSVIEANDYVRGDGNILHAVIPLEYGKTLSLSSLICYDSNNGRYVASMNDDTQLLLVPAWGWDGCDMYQYGMERFRAVENGAALVSPAIDAHSVGFDRLGNMVFCTDEASRGRGELSFAHVPVREQARPALYHFIAPFIDWVYLILAAALLLASFLKKDTKGERRTASDKDR